MSSFTSLYYHFAFGTKRRSPLIDPALKPRLYAYLGGVIRKNGGSLIAVGGMPDHVHLLAKLSARYAVADVAQQLKGGSSRWVHRELAQPNFEWQKGYGSFTVSNRDVPMIKNYISNQENHHRTVDWKAEIEALCEENGAEFDLRDFD